MKSIWYTSSEGTQYWVQLDRKSGRLEFSLDPISPFVGGGYSEILTADSFEDGYFRRRILGLFGIDAMEEMIAAARALESIPEGHDKNWKEIENKRDMAFFNELVELRSHRARSSPGSPDS